MLLALMQLAQSPDSIPIRTFDRPPAPAASIDSVGLGRPSVRIPTPQGTALVWLLRAADTVFIAASIPDSTPSWRDDFVLSLDTEGDAAPSPQHDDFQWDLRRVLDSSVIYRGRNGRWEPPRDDPDWRIGRERSGGGWEVGGSSARSGWSLLLRLDPAWFRRNADHPVGMALRIFDEALNAWYIWPPAKGKTPPTAIEQSPALWLRVYESPI
jgi:hypothetical protein